MKWRIRPGFKLFATADESAEFQAGNQAVRPLADEGKTIVLTAEQLRQIWARGELGALIPLDAEADAYFGDTKPRVAKSNSRPPAHITRSTPPEAA